MREITIDFKDCFRSPVAGYRGEHNATEIKIIKPDDLNGTKYLLAFMTNGEIIRSRFFTADEEIKVKLWKQLTQDTYLPIQIESYDDIGNYIGKSAIAKLIFIDSINGTNAPADTDNPDLISEISANTSMRKTLANNADVLIKFSVSDSGELFFNEKPIGSGSDGFSPIVDISEIEGGHRVTITDSEGEKTFDVLDGVKGDPFTYEDFTPEQLEALKGDDYVLTDADKTEIAEITAGIIDTALLNAIGSGVLE